MKASFVRRFDALYKNHRQVNTSSKVIIYSSPEELEQELANGQGLVYLPKKNNRDCDHVKQIVLTHEH